MLKTKSNFEGTSQTFGLSKFVEFFNLLIEIDRKEVDSNRKGILSKGNEGYGRVLQTDSLR